MLNHKLLNFKKFLMALCLGTACLTSSVTAQTIESICSFTNTGFASPRNLGSGLTLIGSDLYGTTIYGGTGGFGIAFKITTTGALTVLANFGGNNTGAHPVGNMVLGPDGKLYGMTFFSGIGGGGTIFQMTTNGGLSVLYSFNTTNGASPRAGLTMGPDGCFYGTTSQGGTNNRGTIFKITLNGTLTTLFSFAALSGVPSTNSTGAEPYSPLILGPDGNFYGTTFVGGSIGDGTVFRVTTNGTFTVLTNFVDSNGNNAEGNLTGGPDGNIYGTTLNGGIYGDEGTVFKITTNGVVSTLVSFNNMGAAPQGGVTFGPDGNLYGTASSGTGNSSNGTIFRLTTNGVLTTLANFAGTNGNMPESSLTLGPDGNFYGTTYLGGSTDPNAAGEVFRFNIGFAVSGPPRISKGNGGAIILNLPGMSGSTNLLWMTTNATLPINQWQVMATNIATNGLFQFTDTNTTGPMKFYRFTSQ